MTPTEFSKKTGIEHLRLMVSNFNSCNESFLDQFSPQQLFKLHKAWMLCDWDIYPDQWNKRQVREALRGIPPQWSHSTGKPVYGTLNPEQIELEPQ